MPLNGFSSLCGEHASRIVSKDRKNDQKHIANNIDRSSVTQYQIDGVVITGSQSRCDFLVMNDDRKDAYLIELKGSDISKAVIQLEATATALRHQLDGYDINYRIVHNRCNTQEILTSQVLKFKKAHKGKIKMCSKRMKEDI